jgi:hypothetical protein
VLLRLRRRRKRDDQQLVEPGPLEHVDPLEELIRVVNEAQERDARTNVVFMIPSSANGRHFSTKAGRITATNLRGNTSLGMMAGSRESPRASNLSAYMSN